MKFQSLKKNPRFEFDTSLVPDVFITQQALAKMSIYVDTCKDEVGWLGTADMHINEGVRQIVIDDTYLIDQEVHATTTELTPEGLSELAMEIMQQPDGMDIWNRMRMWGHSHVNMSTSPSGQDDKQMREFKEIGHDWFVRLIANKKGDIRIDFYDYKNGITMLDLNWNEAQLPDAISEGMESRIAEMQEQIDTLLKALDARKAGYVKTFEEPIKEEMKVKVRKKTYPTYNGYKGAGKQGNTSNWWNKQGSEDTKRYTQQTYDPYDQYAFYEDYYGVVDTTTGETPVFLSDEQFVSDEFETVEQLKQFFTDEDLLEIARVKSEDELEEFMIANGFVGTFTEDEGMSILKVAIEHYSKYKGA